MITIHEIGWNYKHPNDMLSVRFEHGTPTYLLVLFRSPTTAVIAGSSLSIAPPACILYEPFTPQIYYPTHYKSDPGGFWTNDYIHFAGEDVKTYVSAIGIPFNTVIKLDSHEALCNEIKELAEIVWAADRLETHSALTPFKTDNKMRGILLLLAEKSLLPAEVPELLDINPAILYDIKATRTYVMEHIHIDWNVARMAAHANVSASYFHKIYKKLLGITPNQDLNRRRLERAKYYLGCTDYTIREIAGLLGYKNEYYFIRFFSGHTGLTPGRYARMRNQNETSNILYINERPL